MLQRWSECRGYGFQGQENPNKVQLLMSGHHVTLERLFGQGHMT